MESQESRSPLKGKLLRLPGQSVQDALDDIVLDKLIPYFMFVVFLALLTGMEWVAVAASASTALALQRDDRYRRDSLFVAISSRAASHRKSAARSRR